MWYIIGILPWLIIIWLVIPESFTTAVVITFICVALYILFFFVYNKITTKLDAKKSLDREKAIDEWERKWGRKHPSRMIDSNRNNLKQSK